MMTPLDIVKTPKGGIALIVETNNNGTEASINYIINPAQEHNAWWMEYQLELITTLPRLLAESMYHPFGKGKKDVEELFKIIRYTK